MPKHSLVAVSLIVCLFAALGCERRESAGNEHLQSARELIERASQGYTESGQANPDDPTRLEQFRQRMLDKALGQLERAVQAGSPQQQVAARRLLADVHASAARRTTRQATTAYADLAASANKLISQLRAVDRLANQAAVHSQDRSAIRDALQAEIQAQQEQQSSAQSEAEELKGQIAELENKRDQHRQAAKQANQQQHKLEQQAFDAEGDQRYKLLDQASEAGQRANKADTQAERVQVRIERLNAQLSIVQTKLSEIGKALKNLNAQLDQWRERQREADQQLEAVQQKKAEAAQKLVDQFKEAQSQYEQQVHQALTAAGGRMQDAVSQLQEAANQAGGDQHTSVRQDLLAKRVTQTYVLNEHVMVAAGFGRTISILAHRAPQIMPQRADTFVEARRNIVQQQQDVVDAAREAAQNGQTVADELLNATSEGTDLYSFATTQDDYLRSYVERVNENDLE